MRAIRCGAVRKHAATSKSKANSGERNASFGAEGADGVDSGGAEGGHENGGEADAEHGDDDYRIGARVVGTHTEQHGAKQSGGGERPRQSCGNSDRVEHGDDDRAEDGLFPEIAEAELQVLVNALIGSAPRSAEEAAQSVVAGRLEKVRFCAGAPVLRRARQV